MDIEENFLHQARKEVIKITGHLLDARRGLFLALPHCKLVGNRNPTCKAIEQNLDAMVTGMIETVKLCGQAADELKQQMATPNAIPPPQTASLWVQLTPFQRQLSLQGVKFDTIPKYLNPTKTEQRIAKILPFTPHTTKRRKKRNKTPDNPPL